MRSVCLLTSNELGVKFVTPPLHIRLKQKSAKYALKASYPRNKGNYVPPVEIKVRSYMNTSVSDNSLSGILCFDNGSSDGFFVAWGLVASARTDSGSSHSTLIDSSMTLKPSAKLPWCKILEWKKIMGKDYGRNSPHERDGLTNEDLRVRFQSLDEAPTRVMSFADSRVSSDMRSSPVQVKTKISSIDFLGRSTLELEIDVGSPD
jgi:hypothetical protein